MWNGGIGGHEVFGGFSAGLEKNSNSMDGMPLIQLLSAAPISPPIVAQHPMDDQEEAVELKSQEV